MIIDPPCASSFTIKFDPCFPPTAYIPKALKPMLNFKTI